MAGQVLSYDGVASLSFRFLCSQGCLWRIVFCGFDLIESTQQMEPDRTSDTRWGRDEKIYPVKFVIT